MDASVAFIISRATDSLAARPLLVKQRFLAGLSQLTSSSPEVRVGGLGPRQSLGWPVPLAGTWAQMTGLLERRAPLVAFNFAVPTQAKPDPNPLRHDGHSYQW
jgi:hypothetical protein